MLGIQESGTNILSIHMNDSSATIEILEKSDLMIIIS